jgi:enhancer of mRNA-decapping protein 4
MQKKLNSFTASVTQMSRHNQMEFVKDISFLAEIAVSEYRSRNSSGYKNDVTMYQNNQMLKSLYMLYHLLLLIIFQALSASDLNLVMFVCETVNPNQVFDQEPCPLHQPVLLSLIQQLSADLVNHTKLKHK